MKYFSEVVQDETRVTLTEVKQGLLGARLIIQEFGLCKGKKTREDKGETSYSILGALDQVSKGVDKLYAEMAFAIDRALPWCERGLLEQFGDKSNTRQVARVIWAAAKHLNETFVWCELKQGAYDCWLDDNLYSLHVHRKFSSSPIWQWQILRPDGHSVAIGECGDDKKAMQRCEDTVIRLCSIPGSL